MKYWILALLAALSLTLNGCGVQKLPEYVPDTMGETMEDTVTPSEIIIAETWETEPVQTVPQETTEQTIPVPEEIPEQPEPEDADFVRMTDYLDGILVELKYAAQDNFTGQVIYEFQDAYLRYGTVKKLLLVQNELADYGFRLKIWDGFRPVSAQFTLWEVCPDPTYVANPEKGYSSHSRGNTVDLTLVYEDGGKVEMPTGFDDFSAMADRDYSDCPEEAAGNAQLLQQVMEKHGFKGYFGEWWHFSDTESYPVEETFQPVAAAKYYADCNEYINLRTRADASSESLTQIPAGEEFLILAHCGDFALADYNGLRGYVHRGFIQPVK